MSRALEILGEELGFKHYQALVRVSYRDTLTAQEVGDVIRASSGVTRVTNAGDSGKSKHIIFRLKLMSKKPAADAFTALKERILSGIPAITKFEVAGKTVTQV